MITAVERKRCEETFKIVDTKTISELTLTKSLLE